jgi:predicted GIY-YIG superfamily endonuclease
VEGVMSYVYVFRCDNYYKIGRTKNVARRISHLQSGSPYQIHYVAAVKCYCDTEQDHALCFEAHLHRYFQNCRKRGEWFCLDEHEFPYRLIRERDPFDPGIGHGFDTEVMLQHFFYREAVNCHAALIHSRMDYREFMDVDEGWDWVGYSVQSLEADLRTPYLYLVSIPGWIHDIIEPASRKRLAAE